MNTRSLVSASPLGGGMVKKRVFAYPKPSGNPTLACCVARYWAVGNDRSGLPARFSKTGPPHLTAGFSADVRRSIQALAWLLNAQPVNLDSIVAVIA
jgi:hypothetical protein